MLTKPLSRKQSSSLIALEPLQLLSEGLLVSRSFSTSQDYQTITKLSRPQQPLSSGSFRLRCHHLEVSPMLTGQGPRLPVGLCLLPPRHLPPILLLPPPSSSPSLVGLPGCQTPGVLPYFCLRGTLPLTPGHGISWLQVPPLPGSPTVHPYLRDYLIKIRLLYPHSCLCHEVPCRYKDQIQPHNNLQVGPLSSVHSQMRKLRLPECQWLALGRWGSQW